LEETDFCDVGNPKSRGIRGFYFGKIKIKLPEAFQYFPRFHTVLNRAGGKGFFSIQKWVSDRGRWWQGESALHFSLLESSIEQVKNIRNSYLNRLSALGIWTFLMDY